MSDTISVAEYCKRHNTSSQAVYARIKRGSIKSTIVNGLKMVVDEEVAPEQRSDTDITTVLQSIIKDQKKEIKRLHKRIKLLEGQTVEDMQLLRQIITGKVALAAPADTATDDAIEAEIAPAKKKKRKKKRK